MKNILLLAVIFVFSISSFAQEKVDKNMFYGTWVYELTEDGVEQYKRTHAIDNSKKTLVIFRDGAMNYWNYTKEEGKGDKHDNIGRWELSEENILTMTCEYGFSETGATFRDVCEVVGLERDQLKIVNLEFTHFWTGH